MEKLYKLYDGVETFVLFIGYPRSRHSLVGAILDAHPEIIIPHEFNLLGQWESLQSQTASKKHMQKYSLFLKLQQLSMRQAVFGIRANKNNTMLTGDYTYTYNVPGLWQGGYQHRIKVSKHFFLYLINFNNFSHFKQQQQQQQKKTKPIYTILTLWTS